MTRVVGVGGAYHQVMRRSVGVGGVWRSIVARWTGVGGVWKPVWAALSATISDAAPAGTATSGNVSTSSTTVSPVGGVGPYTYAWQLISFSGCTGVAVSVPNVATVYFRFTGVATGVQGSAAWTCVVTDTATAATASVGCTATADNVGALAAPV